jgi:excisionase family DNA binding protein
MTHEVFRVSNSPYREAPRGVTELLTVDEVATRLACSRRTVYRLIAEGRLASLLVRNTRRIRDDELERFVRAAEEEAKAS